MQYRWCRCTCGGSDNGSVYMCSGDDHGLQTTAYNWCIFKSLRMSVMSSKHSDGDTWEKQQYNLLEVSNLHLLIVSHHALAPLTYLIIGTNQTAR